MAAADGLIAANPAKAVPMLREGRTRGPRGTVLTPEQLGGFLKAGAALVEEGGIAPDVFTMLVVLALCGLRFGEAAAAKWGDLQDGMLHVERAVWNRHVDTTKTDDPWVVLVPKPALEQLQAHRQRQISGAVAAVPTQVAAVPTQVARRSRPRLKSAFRPRRSTDGVNRTRGGRAVPTQVEPGAVRGRSRPRLKSAGRHRRSTDGVNRTRGGGWKSHDPGR